MGAFCRSSARPARPRSCASTVARGPRGVSGQARAGRAKGASTLLARTKEEVASLVIDGGQ
eukprot:40100-Pyramimonas_sp.AAC.1